MAVYGAAILDVVDSRESANRAELQAILNRTIADFNELFREILPVPAGITIGDEWELLTDRPRHGYKLVAWFQAALRPRGIEIYAGLGLGGLSTPPAGEIRQLDGACFHLARQALAIAKGDLGPRRKHIYSKRNRVYLLAETGTSSGNHGWLPAGGELAAAAEDAGSQLSRVPLLEIANALIENTEILKSRMTRKQRETFAEYERLGSYRRMAAAGGARQTPGAISQKLNKAEYFTIQRNEHLIGTLLAAMAEGGDRR